MQGVETGQAVEGSFFLALFSHSHERLGEEKIVERVGDDFGGVGIGGVGHNLLLEAQWDGLWSEFSPSLSGCSKPPGLQLPPGLLVLVQTMTMPKQDG
jgi:hypothetical protein